MGHSTFSRIKRTAVVGAGVVAVSLASALPANAALGGAKPGTLGLVPNLVSVSISGNQAVYRFDRALENNVTNAQAGNFRLISNGLGVNAGYIGQSAQVNGSTVRVGFGTDQDLTLATGATVAANTVATDNNPTRVNFLPDSAPVTSSTSNDGTRGTSAAPVLTSVSRESSSTLVYEFDRELQGMTATASNFLVSDAGTTETAAAGGTATIDRNRVRVTFVNGTTALNNARSAFVLNGAVTSATPVDTASVVAGDNTNTITRAALPGFDELTGRADLISARLVPSSFGFTDAVSVEYTFDDAPLNNGTINPGAFELVYAKGNSDTGDSFSIDPNDPRKIIVNFSAPAAVLGTQEYAVSTTVDQNAFTTQGGLSAARNNTDLGGNLNASAAGFTVAPEVLAVAKTDTNQISVTIDTRLIQNPTNAVLLTADGTPIAITAGGTPAGAFQGLPGVKTVTYNVQGSEDVRSAASVFFPANTFVGKQGGSLPQIVGF